MKKVATYGAISIKIWVIHCLLILILYTLPIVYILKPNSNGPVNGGIFIEKVDGHSREWGW